MSGSVIKAISILKSFTSSEPELGVTEIARRTGLTKPTTHRLLVILTRNKLIEKNINNKKYKIGPELYIWGSQYLSNTDVFKAAQPVVKQINVITEEAVSIGILDSANMIIIMKEEALHGLRYAHPVGTSIPAHASATGKALLSELTEKEIDELLPYNNLRKITSRTISNKATLKKELENIRKTGISIDIEGTSLGVVGIASVIRESNGKAVAAISIPTPLARLNPPKIEKIGRLAKLGASLISYRLGYKDKDTPIYDLDELTEWWGQKKGNK